MAGAKLAPIKVAYPKPSTGSYASHGSADQKWWHLIDNQSDPTSVLAVDTNGHLNFTVPMTRSGRFCQQIQKAALVSRLSPFYRSSGFTPA